MTEIRSLGPPELAAYYHHADYAGFGRRLVIDVVDFLVYIAVCGAITIAVLSVWPDPGGFATNLIAASWFVVAFAYLVLLKRSRFRTLGYVLGGVRIVDLHGRRPTIGALVIRLMFAVLGPFNVLLDLIWITTDPARQALRDKFAHTYVIKRNAQPAGYRQPAYTTHFILGNTFVFLEVHAPDAHGVSGPLSGPTPTETTR